VDEEKESSNCLSEVGLFADKMNCAEDTLSETPNRQEIFNLNVYQYHVTAYHVSQSTFNLCSYMYMCHHNALTIEVHCISVVCV
jgi:hypothetical protein